jgi:hypothetical protein
MFKSPSRSRGGALDEAIIAIAKLSVATGAVLISDALSRLGYGYEAISRTLVGKLGEAVSNILHASDPVQHENYVSGKYNIENNTIL